MEKQPITNSRSYEHVPTTFESPLLPLIVIIAVQTRPLPTTMHFRSTENSLDSCLYDPIVPSKTIEEKPDFYY